MRVFIDLSNDAAYLSTYNEKIPNMSQTTQHSIYLQTTQCVSFHKCQMPQIITVERVTRTHCANVIAIYQYMNIHSIDIYGESNSDCFYISLAMCVYTRIHNQ